MITGLSGSGKSSLAFDTIYAEGQRRYVESLSAYARQFLGQMDKPDVDSIEGLSPAISIDQKTTSRNPRSTVGTVTEIYDYLRLLWARVGKPHCPICGRPIVGQSAEQIIDQVMELARGHALHGARAGRAGAQGRVRQAARRAARRRLRAGEDRRPRAHARGVDRARQALQARHLGRRGPPRDAPRPAQAPGGLDRDRGGAGRRAWWRSRSSRAGRARRRGGARRPATHATGAKGARAAGRADRARRGARRRARCSPSPSASPAPSTGPRWSSSSRGCSRSTRPTAPASAAPGSARRWRSTPSWWCPTRRCRSAKARWRRGRTAPPTTTSR